MIQPITQTTGTLLVAGADAVTTYPVTLAALAWSVSSDTPKPSDPPKEAETIFTPLVITVIVIGSVLVLIGLAIAASYASKGSPTLVMPQRP